MLIGKHWQESTIYRAANAFEQAFASLRRQITYSPIELEED